MADRGKVLKGLEHCVTESDCRGCVYCEQMNGRYDGYKCDCIADALALLKEQEARKKNRLPYSPDSNVQWT